MRFGLGTFLLLIFMWFSPELLEGGLVQRAILTLQNHLFYCFCIVFNNMVSCFLNTAGLLHLHFSSWQFLLGVDPYPKGSPNRSVLRFHGVQCFGHITLRVRPLILIHYYRGKAFLLLSTFSNQLTLLPSK